MSYGSYSSPGSFADRMDAFFTPWVKRLLLANAAVFLVSLVVPLGFLVRWFGFTPDEILFRPWGVFTYMFVHGGFWHVLFNMLVVFFFGPPLERRLGGTEFLKLYLLGGLGGALAGFAFAFSTPVIGASAAVYALMLAFAWYWPNAPIYIWGIFPVKAKYLVGALVVFTFLATFSDAQSVTAHFAHLGGLVAGALYLRFGSGGGGAPSFLSRSPRIPRVAIVRQKTEAGPEGRPDGRPDARSDARSGSRASTRDRGASTTTRSRRADRAEGELLDEVDRILDKISESGMASLSDNERAILDEVSRRRRSN
jgi:membrane associated rhomboid family serine protease